MDLHSQAIKGLNLNIHRLAYRIDTLTNAILKDAKINLTNSQYLVLKSIFILKDSNQKGIANYLGITPAAVCRHINNLRNKNYLINHTPNAKSSNLRLTSEGTKVFKSALIVLHSKMQNKVPKYDALSKLVESSLNS